MYECTVAVVSYSFVEKARTGEENFTTRSLLGNGGAMAEQFMKTAGQQDQAGVRERSRPPPGSAAFWYRVRILTGAFDGIVKSRH
jgi:hypothetical protein